MTQDNKGKQKVLVICPGRGSYNREELGYLARYHSDKKDFIRKIDDYRHSRQQCGVAELDARTQYSNTDHTKGDNASALIYACAMADFLAIDRERYEVVAVTGNSMGWYIALAAANALDPDNAIRLINTMGGMMKEKLIGGQLLYPVIDDNWRQSPLMRQSVINAISDINRQADCALYLSIDLGGYLVVGGNEAGLSALKNALPSKEEKYPMRLFNHGAFHTPLLNGISVLAQQQLPPPFFHAPSLPLIDGRGHIWQPLSTHIKALYQYTLGHQVVAPYHFSLAVETAVKEFAPERLIILGPGMTLGSSVAQTLISFNWQGLGCKADFIRRQQHDPLVLAMGVAEQRARVCSR